MDEDFDPDMWEPRTKLGRKVKSGEITSISEILQMGKRPREVEIVETLVPDLEDEILSVRLVQRMHRSGRRLSFRVTAAVGNGDGIVGVSHTSGREASPAIRKAINAAKLQIYEIKRGCGSWECGCTRPHSVPFKVEGKCGGVRLVILPGPRGLGLVASEVAKIILGLAGIKDCWTRSYGSTRTIPSFAYAVFKALKKTYSVITPTDWVR